MCLSFLCLFSGFGWLADGSSRFAALIWSRYVFCQLLIALRSRFSSDLGHAISDQRSAISETTYPSYVPYQIQRTLIPRYSIVPVSKYMTIPACFSLVSSIQKLIRVFILQPDVVADIFPSAFFPFSESLIISELPLFHFVRVHPGPF